MTYTQTTQADIGQLARLGQNHGYRIAGDLACLNAELALTVNADAAAQPWALQLWACDEPYQGGALEGTKIAEAPVDLQAQPQHLYAETFARLPAGDREYAMVLVLASRASDTEEQVLDFANYPARQHFHVPTLRGEVSYELDPGYVTLRAERIENPRGPENLSGTLALEIWALSEPYEGGRFSGVPLAGVELGRLAGQADFQHIEQRLAAADGGERWHLTIMLREWTARGYVTRDYRNCKPPATALVSANTASVAPSAAAAAPPTAAPVESATPREPATAVAAPAVAAPVESAATATPVHAELARAPSPAAARPQPSPAAAAEPAGVAAPGLVSIQHAPLDQLAAVPGINRKLAQEIVKARPFRSFDELVRVRGIGEKTLRKLRAVLTL